MSSPKVQVKLVPQVASESLIECISLFWEIWLCCNHLFFLMLLSPFCSSAFWALLAQEHNLCCDDLGAAFNSDVAFLFLHLFRDLGNSSVHFLGLNDFSLQETLGTSSWVYTFQVDARVFKGRQTAHPLSSHCCHGNSAVLRQKHAFSSHMGNAAWRQRATDIGMHCMLVASFSGNIFAPFMPFLPHPVVPD